MHTVPSGGDSYHVRLPQGRVGLTREYRAEFSRQVRIGIAVRLHALCWCNRSECVYVCLCVSKLCVFVCERVSCVCVRARMCVCVCTCV